MEALVYQRELTLNAYSSPDWKPTERSPFNAEFDVDEIQKQILQLLANDLNITPLGYSVPEFEELQKQYLPVLRFKRY